MAIFNSKTEEENKTETPATEAQETSLPVLNIAKNRRAVVFPRLSEKGTNLEKLNKYVFRVEGTANKVELRKWLESAYGIKVASINVITVKPRKRRYGRSVGKVSGFKKAVVTLKPDSKKIEIAEAV